MHSPKLLENFNKNYTFRETFSIAKAIEAKWYFW